MSILDSITSILLPSKPKGLLCPKCERELDRHDPDYCKRAMSRRTFFMGVGGVIAAGAASSVLPKAKAGTGNLFNPVADVAGQWEKAKRTIGTLYDVEPVKAAQLVVEAAPKIVTAGVRDYLRFSSNGNWGPKPAGMKINPYTGYYEMLIGKSPAQVNYERLHYGDECSDRHITVTPQSQEYLRRQAAIATDKRRQEAADLSRRRVRFSRFQPEHHAHASVVRFAYDQKLAGPKGKLPA